jgi:hypothetical protein
MTLSISNFAMCSVMTLCGFPLEFWKRVARSNYTFKIKKSFTIAFVSVRANQTMRGTAANQVKRKLNGSGSCNATIYKTYKYKI